MQHHAAHQLAEVEAVRRHRADRGIDLVGLRGLQHVAVRPKLHEVCDELVLVVRAEDDHLHLREVLLDTLGGLDAVEHGHLQVQQHDVDRRMR